MKKRVVFLLVFLLIINLFVVLGETTNVNNDETLTGANNEENSLDQYGSQYEQMQEKIDKIPLDDEGKVDKEKLNSTFNFTKSIAEQRIEKINQWILDNAAWLGFVFRMVPEISWTFAWNLFVIIAFLTHLVFNSRKMWFFIENEGNAFMMGIAAFLILLVTNVYLYIAKGVTYIMDIFFNKVIVWGFWIALILTIVLIVLIIVLAIFAPEVLFFIFRFVGRLFGKKIAKGGKDAAVNKVVREGEKVIRRAKEINERNKAFSDAAYSQAA